MRLDIIYDRTDRTIDAQVLEILLRLYRSGAVGDGDEEIATIVGDPSRDDFVRPVTFAAGF